MAAGRCEAALRRATRSALRQQPQSIADDGVPFPSLYSEGIIIQATRYFRGICFAVMFYESKKRYKLWKAPDTKSGSRRTMPPYFSLTIKLGCSQASGTSS